MAVFQRVAKRFQNSDRRKLRRKKTIDQIVINEIGRSRVAKVTNGIVNGELYGTVREPDYRSLTAVTPVRIR